jgi:hypothetical protein
MSPYRENAHEEERASWRFPRPPFWLAPMTFFAVTTAGMGEACDAWHMGPGHEAYPHGGLFTGLMVMYLSFNGIWLGWLSNRAGRNTP